MGLTDLTIFEIVQGILSLLFVSITIILGLKLISKYREYKRIELIPVSLMMNAHHQWSGTISFVSFTLLDILLGPPPVYMLIALVPVPLSLFFWIYTFSHLVYPRFKKKILIICAMIVIINEFIIIYNLIIDYTIIGTVSKFDLQLNPLLVLLLVFTLEPFYLGSMFIFLRHSLRSNDPKIRWMGKLIFLYHFSFFVATMLDGLPLPPIWLIIARFLLIFSSISNYLGWFMPERVERWLIKGDYDVSVEVTKQKDDVQDFLELLKAKPKKLTEEEVTFHREKKICLVCKGKVLGFTFICECDALYCEKCARAITQLENACWACNGPIDKSKPVRLYEKEEEVKISEITEKSKK